MECAFREKMDRIMDEAIGPKPGTAAQLYTLRYKVNGQYPKKLRESPWHALRGGASQLPNMLWGKGLQASLVSPVLSVHRFVEAACPPGH